jgi:hypothetical protein
MLTVLEEFRLQSRFCAEFNSLLTSQLLTQAADDIEAGGIVARLTDNWKGHPRVDAVSLRFAGALHAAVLTGRDLALAAEYPPARADWSSGRIWPVALDYLARDAAWVRDFMKSPPQTNETARSTGLASGFMWLADRSPQPFYMLELGASAGLNLNWDRFAYAYPAWGRARVDGPLMPTEVKGVPPPWREIAIASRRACDQNPLDATNADHRLRLRAYIWADQSARLERLNAAIALARETGIEVDKADAAAWVRERLQGELPEGTTVVYHSVFLQYPPQNVRAEIVAAIEEAGARATDTRRLAWISFEPESIVGGPHGSTRYILRAVTWRAGERREAILADVDPHGRYMTWNVEG